MAQTPASPARPETINEDLLTLLPEGGVDRALEIGCGSGALGRALKEKGLAREVVGVEVAGVAEVAARQLDRVHRADVETWEPPPDYREHFDCLLLGDVLEHLREPGDTLRRLRPLLRPGAVALASVPNVRCLSVVLPLLLRGEWQYADSGLLDRSHLRFFTRRSLGRLFTEAGFTVETLRPRRQLSRAGRIAERLTRGLGALEEFATRQYVLRARRD